MTQSHSDSFSAYYSIRDTHTWRYWNNRHYSDWVNNECKSVEQLVLMNQWLDAGSISNERSS
jgi:hypothetical protein